MACEFPQTTLEPSDDPSFLAIVDRLIGGLMRRHSPADVYLIHIDNWFGPRWLRFSGRGVVAFPMGYAQNILVALDEHFQEQLTFPPFTRNRVVAQHYFARLGDGMYEEHCPRSLVHRRVWRWKEQHVHRRVADFSASALYVWYSSGTVRNGRGSIMVYQACDGVADGWYASLVRGRGWRVGLVKGIDRDVVVSLVD